MNKTEFNTIIRQLSGKTGLLNLAKIAALDDGTKSDMVYHIVRNRGPVVKDLIPASFNRSWLAACGYLYETKGKHLTFVHTSEHRII
jgi:hypothetical protein